MLVYFLEQEMNARYQLLCWDSLKKIKDIANEAVDCIITSPPYFMGKDYDTSIKIEDFCEIHKAIFSDLYRILKKWGNLCRQVGYHTMWYEKIPLDYLVYSIINQVNQSLDDEDEKLYLKNRIIWTFWHGLHSKKKFSGRHETILWFSKGKESFFDLDAVRVPQKYPWKTYYKWEKKWEFSWNPLGKNPWDVWEIPNVKANHIEKTKHPCQFPVALIERLVKSLCPSDWVVLDPFMGSGTTGVASLLHGRMFIWIELKKEYYEIAKKRCEDTIQWKIKYRIDKPVYRPSKNLAVAKKPNFFI